jgi:hypothetical protein
LLPGFDLLHLNLLPPSVLCHQLLLFLHPDLLSLSQLPPGDLAGLVFCEFKVISRFLLPDLDLLLLGSLFHVHLVGDLEDTRVVDVAHVTLVLKTFGTRSTGLCCGDLRLPASTYSY